MASLVGTAGHVDHGKTSLIRALTGIDADRLPEEKQRGLTIDLGYAFLDLPGVGRVSIVDVPGHEKFVSNMLVGATALDVVLLCVAMDEGVMPQTREHFSILRLLPVERLVVVLTRCDLGDEVVEELVREDVEDLLAGSRFEGAPVVACSAVTGDGLEELKEVVGRELASVSKKPDGDWFLAVDRVFSKVGHGTVVTGSLQGGRVSTGVPVRIWPRGYESRIRGLQVHGESVEVAEPGMRVAMNLGGVSVDDVGRGCLVSGATGGVSSLNFDGRVEWLVMPKHGSRVRVSVGADEAIGRVFLNDYDDGLVQIRTERAVGLMKGMPFVLRQYSPPTVLGGGVVTVPSAEKRRKSAEVSGGKDEGVLGTFWVEDEGLATAEIARRMGVSEAALASELEAFKSSGEIVGLAGLWLTAEGFGIWVQRFEEALREGHRRWPEKSLLARESVASAAGWEWRGKPLDRMVSRMVDEGILRSFGTGIALAEYRPVLKEKQRLLLDRVLEALLRAGVNVPSAREMAGELGVPLQAVEGILEVGIEAGEVLRLDEGVFYPVSTLDGLRHRVSSEFGGRRFTAAEFRDTLGTSRKYAIPLLEWMDRTGLTIRHGEVRVVVGR